MPRSAFAFLFAALVSSACSQPAVTPPYPAIDSERMRTHVERLATADAAGTEPGGRGEQLAVEYLTNTFSEIGLSVQTQTVQLTRITQTSSAMKVSGSARSRSLRARDEYVAWTRRHQSASSVDAEMVFVGYGISAPVQGWDDYKNVDVKGKVLLMLIGDPRAGQRHLLGEMAGDYFGRRQYKFDEAARRGAAGAILIHVADRIDESWDEITRLSADVLDIGATDEVTTHLPVEGWITTNAATELAKEAGLDFAELRRLAEVTNFTPVTLPLRASVEVVNVLSPVTSKNVVATLDAAKTKAEPDYVLYSSQWNHLPAGGRIGADLTDADPENQPPPGAPVLLELARALAREPARQRSFVFLVISAEAEGLLGLSYYLEYPVHPLARTRAAIHLAGFSVGGDHRRVTVIGSGYPALKGLVREQATAQFRITSADKDPERRRFFGSAEAMYTEKSVPSIFLASRPAHESSQPEARQAGPLDMSVGILDARLLFQVGIRAGTGNWPEWKPPRATTWLPGAPAGTEGRRPRRQRLP
jgi:Zn-dependent M28 family amino/carboxypeptidase